MKTDTKLCFLCFNLIAYLSSSVGTFFFTTNRQLKLIQVHKLPGNWYVIFEPNSIKNIFMKVIYLSARYLSNTLADSTNIHTNLNIPCKNNNNVIRFSSENSSETFKN